MGDPLLPSPGGGGLGQQLAPLSLPAISLPPARLPSINTLSPLAISSASSAALPSSPLPYHSPHFQPQSHIQQHHLHAQHGYHHQQMLPPLPAPPLPMRPKPQLHPAHPLPPRPHSQPQSPLALLPPSSTPNSIAATVASVIANDDPPKPEKKKRIRKPKSKAPPKAAAAQQGQQGEEQLVVQQQQIPPETSYTMAQIPSTSSSSYNTVDSSMGNGGENGYAMACNTPYHTVAPQGNAYSVVPHHFPPEQQEMALATTRENGGTNHEGATSVQQYPRPPLPRSGAPQGPPRTPLVSSVQHAPLPGRAAASLPRPPPPRTPSSAAAPTNDANGSAHPSTYQQLQQQQVLPSPQAPSPLSHEQPLLPQQQQPATSSQPPPVSTSQGAPVHSHPGQGGPLLPGGPPPQGGPPHHGGPPPPSSTPTIMPSRSEPGGGPSIAAPTRVHAKQNSRIVTTALTAYAGPTLQQVLASGRGNQLAAMVGEAGNQGGGGGNNKAGSNLPYPVQQQPVHLQQKGHHQPPSTTLSSHHHRTLKTILSSTKPKEEPKTMAHSNDYHTLLQQQSGPSGSPLSALPPQTPLPPSAPQGGPPQARNAMPPPLALPSSLHSAHPCTSSNATSIQHGGVVRVMSGGPGPVTVTAGGGGGPSGGQAIGGPSTTPSPRKMQRPPSRVYPSGMPGGARGEPGTAAAFTQVSSSSQILPAMLRGEIVPMAKMGGGQGGQQTLSTAANSALPRPVQRFPAGTLFGPPSRAAGPLPAGAIIHPGLRHISGLPPAATTVLLQGVKRRVGLSDATKKAAARLAELHEDSPSTSKNDYRTLKHRFRHLVYENECYENEIRRKQRELLSLMQQKDYLLDKVAVAEALDETDDSDLDETDETDDSEEEEEDEEEGGGEAPKTKKAKLQAEDSDEEGNIVHGEAEEDEETDDGESEADGAERAGKRGGADGEREDGVRLEGSVAHAATPSFAKGATTEGGVQERKTAKTRKTDGHEGQTNASRRASHSRWNGGVEKRKEPEGSSQAASSSSPSASAPLSSPLPAHQNQQLGLAGAARPAPQKPSRTRKETSVRVPTTTNSAKAMKLSLARETNGSSSSALPNGETAPATLSTPHSAPLPSRARPLPRPHQNPSSGPSRPPRVLEPPPSSPATNPRLVPPATPTTVPAVPVQTPSDVPFSQNPSPQERL